MMHTCVGLQVRWRCRLGFSQLAQFCLGLSCLEELKEEWHCRIQCKSMHFFNLSISPENRLPELIFTFWQADVLGLKHFNHLYINATPISHTVCEVSGYCVQSLCTMDKKINHITHNKLGILLFTWVLLLFVLNSNELCKSSLWYH